MKHVSVPGGREGKSVGIAWRTYDDDWSEDDFREDKEFVIQELEPWVPHIVYVNGQSVLIPELGKRTVEIRHTEPEFERLMEA